MKTKNLFFLVLASMFASSTFAAALTVRLSPDNVQLNYEQPVRLEAVLRDSIANSISPSLQSFSLGNQLFNLEKQNQADKLKQDVLTTLNQLEKSSNKTIKQFANHLKAQINTWDVGYREFINLDYDWVRISPADNPMLNGKFELISTKRPKTIELLGMFESSSHVEFDSLSSGLIGNTADFVNYSSKLPGAHNSYFWVIYPDGNYQRIGYAYWNYENVSLTPGTALYLGINSNSKEIKQLEQQIIELITMRRGVK